MNGEYINVRQDCCNCHWYVYNNGEFECRGAENPCEEYLEYKYLHIGNKMSQDKEEKADYVCSCQ